MTRRRLSTGLPPNFRYPLMTPDNDRESFIGYDASDDDAGQSRDYPVYPAYKAREKSPAPQIVRVARQPEMIRRQSLRPYSGDWGSYDLTGPSDDSKIPGSFQDTDAEDLETEIIRAVPRSAYGHRAEVADLYPDVSEENSDFGHDETLVFPQLPLEDVVQEVAYILRTKSSPAGEGFTYVFADPTGHNKFYQIGSAKNVSKRANEHRGICNISSFRVQRKPSIPIRQYKRLEKLAQAELINMSYDPNCVCSIQQRQYFWGREQTAFEILEFWSKWLLRHSPYDKNGHLLPFWEHRLRAFESNIPKYFDCKQARCIKRTTDTVACPICLRAGWKAWAEPDGRDKIEFASRTQLGGEWANKILMYLYKYVPIPENIYLASVDGIGWAVSQWDRFKNPALLLNVLYARLLIPMLWSTIFTASDTVPFIAMMEIVLFSVIYQLVRLELAQIAAQGSAAEKYGRVDRLLRRKALPLTFDRADGSSRGKSIKEPKIIEIPDDRAQNAPKQTTPSVKGSGRKSESVSMLFPGEAAARIKRLKPAFMYPSPNSGGRSDEEKPEPSKRTARACDACYTRKIKCDAVQPRCNWCSHHNIPCTFERKLRRTRKKPTTPKNSSSLPGAHLSERLARIERLLAEKLPQEQAPAPTQKTYTGSNSVSRDLTPSPPGLVQSTTSSSVPLHFAGKELGVISLFTGIPFILPEGQEWVQSRTGQKLAFDKFTLLRAPWEKQQPLFPNDMLMQLQNPHSFDLPDRHTIEANFRIYRTSLMQRVFPVVDPVLFWTTIRSAYKERSAESDRAKVSTKACIFAFAAFVLVLCKPCLVNFGREPERLDKDACLAKARFLLCQVLQEPPTLDGLQTVVMLALLELVSGNLQSANYYGSILSRMIFMLGGHTFSNQPSWLPETRKDPNLRAKTHLRNLFWLAYTLEQDVSLRTGQAQLFSEDNCDLSLPPDYVEQMYVSLEYHHTSTDLPENPIFPVDLRLSIIRARAYSALYSFRAMKKTDAEILKDVRELDDELERWRLSVPPKWRPTLSFSHETPDPNCNMHSVILRLNYHLCMTIIHQASSRCKSWVTQGGVMDGVSSSLALSVEASRSTLLYLETAGHVLVDGVFWMIIFYPMSALLTIFCSILQNPAEPQATKDLALLKSATGLLERLFLRQPYSVHELLHVKLVADFVNELCRLATCAMDKAWRERTSGTSTLTTS
ncbi:putative C6 transcription factor [Aspergillus lucknowensis]|uniref:Zn(2)-C6 fungal-type domain-containing protein n=1 Tax=Aspergillus lucknowensis TaxID=176173 RepID=A0ABR4M300_9EURO